MEYIIPIIDNINNINQLPREFNNDNINNLITILSDYNKKLLLLSCLNELIIINRAFLGPQTFNINTLINLFLRQYNMGFIIYPLNLNIIHFILFNKLDINILLKVIIYILYNKNVLIISNGGGGSLGIINQPFYQTDNIININLMESIGYRKPNSLLQPLIKLMCESIDSNIININFNNNYEKLLLIELNKDINLENKKDSIYFELITKIKELENKYEKLENKYEELLKTKIITIIE